MKSFAELWEDSRRRHIRETALLRPDMDDKRSSVVLAKQEPEFCERLAEIANMNSQALGELLGVTPEEVKRWHKRITDAAKIANKAKAESQQKVMMPTGV
jgi:hypothetical protein